MMEQGFYLTEAGRSYRRDLIERLSEAEYPRELSNQEIDNLALLDVLDEGGGNPGHYAHPVVRHIVQRLYDAGYIERAV